MKEKSETHKAVLKWIDLAVRGMFFIANILFVIVFANNIYGYLVAPESYAIGADWQTWAQATPITFYTDSIILVIFHLFGATIMFIKKVPLWLKYTQISLIVLHFLYWQLYFNYYY